MIILLLLVFGVPVLMTLPRDVRWAVAAAGVILAWPVGLVVAVEALIAEIAVRPSC